MRAAVLLLLGALVPRSSAWLTTSQARYGAELEEIQASFFAASQKSADRSLGWLWSAPNDARSNRGLGGSITWAWDAAELLHHSTRWSDVLTHAAVCCAALALFAFNATVEIPHFFRYHPSDTHDAATVKRLSVLKCSQDVESALWLKRLPFFFSYFLVASWGSAALSYRYLRRGGLRRTDD